jgi:hypothetical protein
LHCYGARAATNAPDPTGYTQDAEAVVSGTLVINAGSQVIADQNTTLSNQDASPTSGARWASGLICIPGTDYPYYRSGSQGSQLSGTSVNVALPAGTLSSDVNGNKDLIIATVEAAGTAPSPNTSADWTEIAVWSSTTSGGATTVRKYWALYDGSIDARFNRTGTGEISACLTTYYNCHQTTPIGNSDADARASSTTSTWDALSRSYSHSLVQATCVADATPTFTAPAGWSERMDGLGITCADQTFNAVGSAASASFTLSTASSTLVGLIEIKSPTGVGAIDLVVQDATHAHAAGSVTLTQAHELAVNNPAHGHSAASIMLTQAHTLVVQDSSHAHSATNPALTQIHELVVTSSAHQHAAESVAIVVVLTVADATQAHVADSIDLTQLHLLVISDASHGHSAESVTIAVASALETQDATHAHVADSATITQVHGLLVADSVHGHAADSMLLTQLHELVAANGTHGQVADSLTLTQTHALTVADAVHLQATDSLELVQVHAVTVQSGTHLHAVSNVALGMPGTLEVADGVHGHVGESVTMSQLHELSIESATHAHASDNVTLTLTNTLSVQDCAHGHIASSLDLTQLHAIQIDGAVHDHSATMLALTQAHTLVPQDGQHAHIAAEVGLTSDILQVNFSPRQVMGIGSEQRMVHIGTEVRST